MESSNEQSKKAESIQGLGKTIYPIELEDIYAGLLLASVYSQLCKSMIEFRVLPDGSDGPAPELIQMAVESANAVAEILVESRFEIKRSRNNRIRDAATDSIKEA